MKTKRLNKKLRARERYRAKRRAANPKSELSTIVFKADLGAGFGHRAPRAVARRAAQLSVGGKVDER